MEDSDFSDEFCRFLQATIPSVEAAELLLLLARNPDARWELGEAVAASGAGTTLTTVDAQKHVDQFIARGLVEVGADRRVRFLRGAAELTGYVDTLARAYKERPVTLFRMIYALRDSKIKSFADAFRFRKP